MANASAIPRGAELSRRPRSLLAASDALLPRGKMFSPGRVSQMLASVARGKRFFSGSDSLKENNFWEPDYLKLAKSKFPEYDNIIVQMKGYDYAILENYQSMVHKFAKQMRLDVSGSWAQELKKYEVTRLKPKSEVIECKYTLNCYERNIKISKVYSYQLSIFLELIATACPPTVNIKVQHYDPMHEEIRYVPEYKILELQERLKQVGKK